MELILHKKLNKNRNGHQFRAKVVEVTKLLGAPRSLLSMLKFRYQTERRDIFVEKSQGHIDSTAFYPWVELEDKPKFEQPLTGVFTAGEVIEECPCPGTRSQMVQ
jgi:hypothetical protein